MKGYQIVWPEKGRAELAPYDIGEPAAHEVLIQTAYSVLSAGTEKSWLLAMPNAQGKFPQHPGYSGSGTVLKVGSEVTRLRPGDRVLLDHKGHRSHVLAAEDEPTLLKIPDGVELRDAAFVVIGSMGLQGVRKAKLELGESVLVQGLGILGMFALQTAKLSGGLPVLAADFDAGRRRVAAVLGADLTLSPDDPAFAEKVMEKTDGRGVNAVIEVSGSAKALQQALTVCARQGRVVLTGCTRISDEPIDFYRYVHRTGVQIIGAHNFVRPAEDSYPGYWTRRDDFRVLLELLRADRLKASAFSEETVSPRNAPEVYARLISEKRSPLGSLFDWNQL